MSKHNMSVDIAGVHFKNPITTASGTFASGKEFSKFVDLNMLGAITVKGVSLKPWKGNAGLRIAETYGGMLNSIGLQNPGAEAFVKDDLPFLKKFDTKIIVNVCGHTIPEYLGVIERLSDEDIDLFELNISCPNVTEGGLAFGTNCDSVFKVVSEAKKIAKKPLIVKLSPNVTDITEIAKSAVSAGADGISLINTLLGMKIDIHNKRPVLGNIVGGLSGPAIMPVALRMVYQVAKAVEVPIIGMGGISSSEDAIQFIMAGAWAVAIGTANFNNPCATTDVINGIYEYMDKYDIEDISEIRGII